MSFGLPSRLLGSNSRDFQNGSSVHYRDSTGTCMAGSNRCNRCIFPHDGEFAMRLSYLRISAHEREGGFQLRNSCKGVEESRAFIRNAAFSYCGTSLRANSLRGRASRPHSYVNSSVDDNMAYITEWHVSGQLPAATANSFCSKGPFSPAIRECRDVDDCHLRARPPFLAVRCNGDSSDKGKEEVLWKNESVTTASGALAEWRSARTRSGQDIVDWGRYHLQVMFVDRSHKARSRLAEGLFERIAAWNGFGLILYGHSCGISAKEGELPSMSYQGEAQRLGVARHVFKAPATTLDRPFRLPVTMNFSFLKKVFNQRTNESLEDVALEIYTHDLVLCSDLDSYDLIVAMDIEVRDEVLRMAGAQSSNGNDYSNKVRLISEFVSYGSTSLLEDTLLEIIQPDLPQAFAALEVQATYMSQYSKWRMMIATITMCCAGLIRFLMDAYPDDLPDYDPVD